MLWMEEMWIINNQLTKNNIKGESDELGRRKGKNTEDS